MTFKIGDTVVLATDREGAAGPMPGEGIGVVSRLDGPDSVYVSWAERGESVCASRLAAVERPAGQSGSFRLGDLVIGNPLTWIPNDFDSWGRGKGVGVVVPSPFGWIEDEVDVVWDGGRCMEQTAQLLHAP